MIEEPIQHTLFKILFGGEKGLGLVKIIGDRFLIAPFFQEIEAFEICNWQNLDQEDLSKDLSSRFGMWGGDIQPNSYSLKSPTLPPGHYYTHCFRPIWEPIIPQGEQWANLPPILGPFQNHLITNLSRSARKLDEILEFIEPLPANMNCFGSVTREFLILVCTEIESSFKSILRHNNYPKKTKKCNIKDYFKTEKILRLSQYQFDLGGRIPSGQYIIPFASWADENCQKPLSFYNAYHAVKHDSAMEMRQATLNSCLVAFSGQVALAISMIGRQKVVHFCPKILDYFSNIVEPNWAFEDQYFYNPDNPNWLSVQHPNIL